MKKIVLLIAVLFLSGLTYGQATWTKYNKVEGRHNQMVKGDSSAVNVYLMSGGSSGDLYVTQLGSPNSYAAWPSTTGTTIDSVSFSFTPKSITFINDATSTDTLFVSASSSFPTANTVRRLGGEGFTKLWAATKLYFKVGTTPAASKKIRIEAN